MCQQTSAGVWKLLSVNERWWDSYGPQWLLYSTARPVILQQTWTGSHQRWLRKTETQEKLEDYCWHCVKNSPYTLLKMPFDQQSLKWPFRLSRKCLVSMMKSTATKLQALHLSWITLCKKWVKFLHWRALMAQNTELMKSSETFIVLQCKCKWSELISHMALTTLIQTRVWKRTACMH